MKKLIKDFIVLMFIISLVMNVRLIIYVLQVERDCDSNIELLEESNKTLEDNNKYLKKDISNLQEQKEYYQNKYYDYFEYTIELEQQMGIYR